MALVVAQLTNITSTLLTRMPQDWLQDIEWVLADDLTAFANNNPDLPGRAAIARRMMEDRARPRSYFMEPDCA